MVNCLWPPSVHNHSKYWFTYKKNHWRKYLKFRKIDNKKCHCTKTVGDGKILIAYLNSAWKVNVTNTINLSCATILLPSVISAPPHHWNFPSSEHNSCIILSYRKDLSFQASANRMPAQRCRCTDQATTRIIRGSDHSRGKGFSPILQIRSGVRIHTEHCR